MHKYTYRSVINVYTHTYTFTDIHSSMHTYIHTSIHTYLHTYTHTHIHTHTHTNTRTFMSSDIHSYTHPSRMYHSHMHMTHLSLLSLPIIDPAPLPPSKSSRAKMRTNLLSICPLLLRFFFPSFSAAVLSQNLLNGIRLEGDDGNDVSVTRFNNTNDVRQSNSIPEARKDFCHSC